MNAPVKSLLKQIIYPFQRFVRLQAAGGILLLVTSLIAMWWANSDWSESYFALWHTQMGVGFGPYIFTRDLHFWINDALMVIFFFVVGLEIKRELLVGELSNPKQALFPMVGAAGGMVVPFLFFVAINPPGSEFFNGWAIPTVTDIAFSLGVLSLLGNRVPIALKVFLAALAIVDDIGAVLIIALFYSSGISIGYLMLSALCLVVLSYLSATGSRNMVVYTLLGIALWIAMIPSGIHTTIAGVALAFTIPAYSKIDVKSFSEQSKSTLARIQQCFNPGDHSVILKESNYQSEIQHLESLCEEAQSPLQRFEHTLQPWVSFAIMPLFALCNAGVRLDFSEGIDLFLHPVSLGIILGLFLGKQIGVTFFTWLSTKLKWTSLPTGISWRQMHGVSLLTGIGFTMSIFITNLAFSNDTHILTEAKVGIFTASGLTAIIGLILLYFVLPKNGQSSGLNNPNATASDSSENTQSAASEKVLSS